MPILVDVPEKYETIIDGAYEYVLISQQCSGNRAVLMPTPMRNIAMERDIESEILPFPILFDRSVIFRVPVFTYKMPIANNINTAPMLPINKYCIAARLEAL
jgi:hypothetical protein